MRMLLTILAIAAVVLVLVWAGQRRLMYFPFGDVPPPAAVGLPSAETIAFQTEDRLTLQGWFLSSAKPSGGFTVLVFNGNAGNRSFRAPLAAGLRALGASVLLFDYRGYGGNPGGASETGLAADARAARRYVSGRPDVDAARLIYFGESLGSGVAVGLAAEHHPAALVLRSPFASMADVGQFHYPILPVRWLLKDRFDSIGRIARIGCPLLVIAGDRDGVVPYAHSQRLFAAAAPPRTFVTVAGADHNDRELADGDQMMRAIGEFLGRIDVKGGQDRSEGPD
jgi:fermentation-respiration switch protein FrsA (DUF1100 family)